MPAAAEHDHPDVGNTAAGDLLESGVDLESLLDDGRVRVSAEGVEAGDDAGGVIDEVVDRERASARALQLVSVAFAHHQHAVAHGAAGRLEHEGRERLEPLAQASQLEVVPRDGQQPRRRDAGTLAQALRGQLVVDARVEAAIVPQQRVLSVAPVDPEDARATQCSDGVHDRGSSTRANARKRMRSLMRYPV
jgi:hypothetical protein